MRIEGTPGALAPAHIVGCRMCEEAVLVQAFGAADAAEKLRDRGWTVDVDYG